MAIDFSPERWARIRDTYRQWWAGELARPLLPVLLTGRDPGRPQPEAPLLTQATCTDLSVTAEALIDRLDYELSTQVYLGDAFPLVALDCFGPGVLAAFLGARIDNHTGNVWFHPTQELPIAQIHFAYDPDNVWFRRILAVCAAAMQRWQGQVLVSMTDLGGILDVLSTFRPAEQLLIDLYDAPDEVKRLTWEAHEAWHRCFTEINAVLQPVNPGYSSWCRIYSDRPYYMLQCDFAYMIGPEMFDEFVKPELTATVRRLPRSFYHLDGIGQLPHLDSLLAITELDGIQWAPGAGNPTCEYWPDLFPRIFAAGKKTQMVHMSGNPQRMRDILATVGVGPGTYWNAGFTGTVEETEEMRRLLQTFGIDD